MARGPWSQVLLAAFLACGVAQAAPVTHDGAFQAVEKWRGGASRHLGRHTGAPTGRTRTFSEDGTNLFHLVELSGGGFVAVSADDTRPPVMAFSPTGELPAEDDGGPLWAMLAADGAAALGRRPDWNGRHPRRRLSMREHRGRPSARLYAADAVAATQSGLQSVSDVRVAPLVQSKWDQTTVNGKNTYNYYTPNHWYSGCTATAIAQIMRYHEYPASATPQTTKCYTNSVAVELTMIGGNYDWNSMPLTPNASTTLSERQAIGRICYDAGVALRMNYTQNGSSSFALFAYSPFIEIFGYANAKCLALSKSTSISSENIEKAILANLDAGCPVLLGIIAPGSDGKDAGHAILADGYGYEDDTLWCHLNMGWSGYGDIWYALPNIPVDIYNFTIISAIVYNVFPSETGELVTGRVTDEHGNPLEGATVTASYTSGGRTISTEATSSATGIYAVKIPAPSFGNRQVAVSATYGAAASGSTSTSIKASTVPRSFNWETGSYSLPSGGFVIGNSWGNNLTVASAAGNAPAVSGFSSATQGGAEGFALSFDGTGGARYEVQFTTNLASAVWTTYTNILVSPSESATLFLPIGDDPAGFWRVIPEK